MIHWVEKMEMSVCEGSARARQLECVRESPGEAGAVQKKSVRDKPRGSINLLLNMYMHRGEQHEAGQKAAGELEAK